MRPPATKLIVFNAAAGLIGVAALVSAVRSVLISPAAAPCGERYHHMTAFNLQRAGVTLTAADLQASLGGKDVGVMENVSVGPLKNAPAPLAMSVVLARASAPGGKSEPRGGMAFPWEPRVLQGKSRACLSYQVLFPADFDFNRGGSLPGIGGGDEQGDRFAARVAWRPKGSAGTVVRVTEAGAMRGLSAERDGYAFARGKWVKVEQEVVLNTPKKNDGAVRLWIDGALAVERTDVVFRASPDVTISRVSVDAFYGSGPDDTAAAPKDARLWLTPFEVRWQ